MRSRFIKLAILGISVSALAGCNSKNVTITADKAKNNEIIVTESGALQGVIKEEFDKKYYNEKELKAFIKEDIEEFNNENGTKVKLNSMLVKEKNVYVVMDYKSTDEYNSYGEYNVSYLNADVAKDSKQVKDKLTVYGKDKTEHKIEALDKDKKVIIIKEKPSEETPYGDVPAEKKVDLNVTVAGKIKYVSGAKKDDGNTAKINTLKEPVVIVYE